ncbi:hypothetical protein ACVW1A_005898 [Bradyrhizobium sp. LB1.3]
MSSKQPKLYTPTGKDIRDNPLIGGSKRGHHGGRVARRHRGCSR